MRRLFLLLFFVLPLSSTAQQLPFDLPVPLPGVDRFDPSIPTPEDVLGHRIGDKHTMPHEVVRYFEAVDQVSDRVVVSEHARTYEGRPLIHAMVSSADNLERLSVIHDAHLRLSDDPSSVSDRDLEDMPVVLYQGYSIHGNEATGTEAAILYLYYLAAAQGPAIDELLSNVVTIVDPMYNPDGRDRFADWVNRNRGTQATVDLADREHNEPWPGGRTNHYWFDLNRDWLPAQHPESQGRMELFHGWRPQVLTDHHEMGASSSFFFQPGIPSRNNPNTPARTFELTAALAEHHARRLDGIGATYYSEESFDDFYLGKGSAFPDVNGAVGILFEQASSRALRTTTTNGVLSYAFGVRNQFLTSLSTLEGAAELRVELLKNHRDFYGAIPDWVAAHPVKGYVVGFDRGAARVDSLLALLRRHQIHAYALEQDIEAGEKTFAAGKAALLPLNQRQGRLLKASFERVFEYEDSLFYDVSTWTLPLAFDVDYAELGRIPSGALGQEIVSPVSEGSIHGERPAYAYLMRWDAQYAPRALYRFQSAGVTAYMASRDFEAVSGGQQVAFEPGTVIIPVRSRDADSRMAPQVDVHMIAEQAAAEDGVALFGVETGLTPSGPDLGGASVRTLGAPAVAVLTGEGTSSYGAGEVWHYLSEHLHMPVSLLDANRLGRTDLKKYTHIVMGGGSYGSVSADVVRAWVSAGGRLIALSSAVDWAVNNDLLDLEKKASPVDSLLEGRPYGDLSAARGAQAVGGSIFTAQLDTTHPLAFGLPATLPLFRQGNTFYEPSDVAGANVATYSELASGYLSDEMEQQMIGSAAVIVQRSGNGRVVAMPDRPIFRAYFLGSARLLSNALFLGSVY